MSRAGTEAAWQAVWMARGWRARLLWPISLLYAALIRRRRRRYARGDLPIERLPVPVIVVGNVVVGGAGKTPAVLALLAHLQAKGWQPGVVSRGHGRDGSEVLELTSDTPASIGGDEPTLILRRRGVPVFVGRQRAEAAKALLSAHPEVDVLVCDDGLQHYALGRDLAIVVFDDRGTGNGWLLPAGLLREPWPPAGIDALTPHLMLHPLGDAPPSSRLPAFTSRRLLAEEVVSADGQRLPLASMRDRSVIAVAGIARPQAFFDMLRASGIEPAQMLPLPDHASDAMLAGLAFPANATVVCTEKDAVKLWPLTAARPEGQRPQVWAVPLELAIAPAFFDAVDRHLANCTSGGGLSSADGQQTA